MRRYVALGDSWTAGLPVDGHGPWPETLAEALRRKSPALTYANLGVVGATTAEIVERQLPPALEQRPDLVSLVCGLNDVLWPLRPDAEAFQARLLAAVRELQQPSPQPLVLLATLPEITLYLSFRTRSKARVAQAVSDFNVVVRDIAGRHGCALIEVERSAELRERVCIASDGYHLSEEGHVRYARAALAAIDGAFGLPRMRQAEAG